MSLFRLGDFTLHSGQRSPFKIDCDALNTADWEALAYIAAQHLPPFGSVEGVPKGGLAFAEALRQHATPGGPLLIADDVSTTGGSLERQRAGRPALGVVVFARGDYPHWVTPLFAMPGVRQDSQP